MVGRDESSPGARSALPAKARDSQATVIDKGAASSNYGLSAAAFTIGHDSRQGPGTSPGDDVGALPHGLLTSGQIPRQSSFTGVFSSSTPPSTGVFSFGQHSRESFDAGASSVSSASPELFTFGQVRRQGSGSSSHGRWSNFHSQEGWSPRRAAPDSPLASSASGRSGGESAQIHSKIGTSTDTSMDVDMADELDNSESANDNDALVGSANSGGQHTTLSRINSGGQSNSNTFVGFSWGGTELSSGYPASTPPTFGFEATASPTIFLSQTGTAEANPGRRSVVACSSSQTSVQTRSSSQENTSSDVPPPAGTKQCAACSAWKLRDQWHKSQWKKCGLCIICVNVKAEREARKRKEYKRAVKAAKAASSHAAQMERRANETRESTKRQSDAPSDARQKEEGKQVLSAKSRDDERGTRLTQGAQPFAASPAATQFGTSSATQAHEQYLSTRTASAEDARGRRESEVAVKTAPVAVARDAFSDDRGYVTSTSPRSSHLKRYRDDYESISSAFGATQAIVQPDESASAKTQSLSKDTLREEYSTTRVVSDQLSSNKGTARRSESNVNTNAVTSGESSVGRVRDRGTPSYEIQQGWTVDSQRSKRIRDNGSSQSTPHSSMVAVREGYQIKHHSSLPRRDGSTVVFSPGIAAKETDSAQNSASRRSRWSAVAARSGYHVRRHDSALPPSETPSQRADSSVLGSSIGNAEKRGAADENALQLVIIDGSNVAYAHRENPSNPVWSPKGVLLSLQYFRDRSIPVLAFVPRPRVDGMSPSNKFKEAILEAVIKGEISLVPTKGNDDLFILSYAIRRNSHIVSNDQFRDHGRNERTLAALGVNKSQLDHFLAEHHVCYTFVLDDFVPDPEASLIRALTQQARLRA